MSNLLEIFLMDAVLQALKDARTRGDLFDAKFVEALAVGEGRVVVLLEGVFPSVETARLAQLAQVVPRAERDLVLMVVDWSPRDLASIIERRHATIECNCAPLRHDLVFDPADFVLPVPPSQDRVVHELRRMTDVALGGFLEQLEIFEVPKGPPNRAQRRRRRASEDRAFRSDGVRRRGGPHYR